MILKVTCQRERNNQKHRHIAIIKIQNAQELGELALKIGSDGWFLHADQDTDLSHHQEESAISSWELRYELEDGTFFSDNPPQMPLEST